MTIPAPDGFDWHCPKYESNLARHRIRFEVAIKAFDDPRALEGFGSAHSSNEDRYWLIGEVQDTMLHVAFSIEDDADSSLVIRIISARLAEKKERHAYAIQAI